MSFQMRRLTSSLNTVWLPKSGDRRLIGYSPLQWWFGTQCAREVEEHGLGFYRSSFERRLEFQTAAQTAFLRADGRKTLRVAQYARSRVLRNPTARLVGEDTSEGAKVGSVAVVIVVLMEKWFSLVLQECWRLNSQQRWSHITSRSSCVVGPWRIFDKSTSRASG